MTLDRCSLSVCAEPEKQVVFSMVIQHDRSSLNDPLPILQPSQTSAQISSLRRPVLRTLGGDVTRSRRTCSVQRVPLVHVSSGK